MLVPPYNTGFPAQFTLAKAGAGMALYLSCRCRTASRKTRGNRGAILVFLVYYDDATETTNIFLASGVVSIIFRSMIREAISLIK